LNGVLEICKKLVRNCKAFENLKSCAPITLGYKQTNKQTRKGWQAFNEALYATCAWWVDFTCS
jgi:hypothetical protein